MACYISNTNFGIISFGQITVIQHKSTFKFKEGGGLDRSQSVSVVQMAVGTLCPKQSCRVNTVKLHVTTIDCSFAKTSLE